MQLTLRDKYAIWLVYYQRPFFAHGEFAMSEDSAARKSHNIVMMDFERDVLSHMKALMAFAYSLTRVRDSAEDLVQDTLLRALKNRHRFMPGTNLKAWLFTIMKNHFLSGLRRKREVLGDEDFWKMVDSTHYASAASLDERMDLEQALADMPEEKLHMILQMDVLGHDYEGMARLMGVPVGTIKSRVSRSRQYMQALLGEAYMPAGQVLPQIRSALEKRALTFNPVFREVTMNEVPLAMTANTASADAHSLFNFAKEINRKRDVYCPFFNRRVKTERISRVQIQDAMRKSGIEMNLQTITNFLGGKSAWNEVRLKVLLELLGLTPETVLMQMRGGMPVAEKVLPEVVPEVQPIVVPEAVPKAAPTTLEMMHSMMRRLLKDKMEALDDGQKMVLLGDLIHRLTRAEA